MEDAKIIPLQQLYLMALVATVNADKLDAVQQDLGQDAGRLWLVSNGTTVPQAQIAYKFGVVYVSFGIITRDERKLSRVVKYAEGIDGFLEQLQKFLQANRLVDLTRARKRAA
jgi:hypothetical protein